MVVECAWLLWGFGWMWRESKLGCCLFSTVGEKMCGYGVCGGGEEKGWKRNG